MSHRPLLVDVLDARKYVARINNYNTPELAAQNLALEFKRIRYESEELKTETLLDAYDRGWNAAIDGCARELREWIRYIASRPEGAAVAGHLEDTLVVIGRLVRCPPPKAMPQPSNGEEGGEHLLEYREKERHDLRRPLAPDPPPKPKCSFCGDECTSRACTGCAAPMIARALFETDQRVRDFVESVGDFNCFPADESKWDFDGSRKEATMQKAWDRNEHGWRAEAEQRARDVMSVVRAVPVPATSEGEGK